MVVVETPIFTRQITTFLDDDDYRKLQVLVANRPAAGAVIPQSGGLRKIRWALPQRGKRGGIRVIYYWAASAEKIVMLLAYAKNERDNLTPAQLKARRPLIESEFP
jgi:mRNA-degrading endonuclease RelE of RelBE toxin-antitoxin system